MKKKYLFFIKLIIGLAPISIVSRFDSLSNNEHSERIKQYATRQEFYNTILLGNSHTYNGIIPEILDSLTEMTSFNLGLPSAGPKTIDLIIKDLSLQQRLKPETLIINIGPEMFTVGADNFELFPIHRHLKNPKSHFFMFQNGSVPFSQLLPSYFKSYRKAFSFFFKYEPKNGKQNNHIYKGFIPKTKIYNGEKNEAYLIYRNAEFDWESFKDFCGIIYRLLKQDKFVFIHEPPNNKLGQYFNVIYLNRYEKYKGKMVNFFNPFHRFSYFQTSESSYTSDYFGDIDHLNMRGARKYSLFLCKQINSRAKSIYYRK